MKTRFLTFTILFCIAGCAASGQKWERNQKNLIYNFNNMYNPCVLETGGIYKYKMWFFGWATGTANPNVPGADAIFHARSKDLLKWEVYSGKGNWDATMNPTNWVPVLHAGNKWYDQYHAGDPSVVMKNGKFYMAFSSTSKNFKKEVPGYPSKMIQCVVGAASADGINWKKTKSPLLIGKNDSANPKPVPNRIADFHRPCLRWEDNKWKLWFDYWLPGKGICMGYSENSGTFSKKNGFKIKHDLKKPVIENWPNPEIIKIGNKYHSFADPTGYSIKKGQSPWMSRQLREAVSSDGRNWKKLPFLKPDKDSSACQIPQTLVTKVDGVNYLYLFYATQIGYKKNDGIYHFQYDHIRAMRREIK